MIPDILNYLLKIRKSKIFQEKTVNILHFRNNIFYVMLFMKYHILQAFPKEGHGYCKHIFHLVNIFFLIV